MNLSRQTRGAIILVVGVAGFSGISGAMAHSFYDVECCSGRDCAPVAAPVSVAATDKGWLVQTTGEVVPYAQARPSPDGRFHRCSLGGQPTARTICLYVPPMGF